MTKAPMIPGTHPHSVKSNTIKKDPQPFPMTERGGKNMANKTLQKLMFQHFDRYSMGRPSMAFVTRSLHQFRRNVPCSALPDPSPGPNGQIKGMRRWGIVPQKCNFALYFFYRLCNYRNKKSFEGKN